MSLVLYEQEQNFSHPKLKLLYHFLHSTLCPQDIGGQDSDVKRRMKRKKTLKMRVRKKEEQKARPKHMHCEKSVVSHIHHSNKNGKGEKKRKYQ